MGKQTIEFFKTKLSTNPGQLAYRKHQFTHMLYELHHKYLISVEDLSELACIKPKQIQNALKHEEKVRHREKMFMRNDKIDPEPWGVEKTKVPLDPKIVKD